MNENDTESKSQTPKVPAQANDAYAEMFEEMREQYEPAPEEILDYCIRNAYHLLDISEKDVFNTIWENKGELIRYICAAFGTFMMITTPEERTKELIDEHLVPAFHGDSKFERELTQDEEEKEFEIVAGPVVKFVLIRPRARGCIDYMGYSIRQIEVDQYNAYEHGSWNDESLAFRGSGNSVESVMDMLHEHWIDPANEKKYQEKLKETSSEDPHDPVNVDEEAAIERAVNLSNQMVTNELDEKRPKIMLVDDEEDEANPADDEGHSDHQEG